VLRHQVLLQPFTEPLVPGESCTFSLKLGPEEEGQGRLRLHLYQTGVGSFSGTGRSAPVTLSCSRAAFLELVRTQPKPDQGP
jgi:hypothetical protein